MTDDARGVCVDCQDAKAYASSPEGLRKSTNYIAQSGCTSDYTVLDECLKRNNGSIGMFDTCRIFSADLLPYLAAPCTAELAAFRRCHERMTGPEPGASN